MADVELDDPRDLRYPANIGPRVPVTRCHLQAERPGSLRTARETIDLMVRALALGMTVLAGVQLYLLRAGTRSGQNLLGVGSDEEDRHGQTLAEYIDDIYRQIQEELRNQYSIGYVSDQGANSTAFRRISLTARNNKSLTVQAPEGYYPAGK